MNDNYEFKEHIQLLGVIACAITVIGLGAYVFFYAM